LQKQGGNDYIDGGDGNDHFYEWQGRSNTIIGSAGDDVFQYVSGAADWDGYEAFPAISLDRLTGGEGRDTYRIGHSGYAPADVITDFKTTTFPAATAPKQTMSCSEERATACCTIIGVQTGLTRGPGTTQFRRCPTTIRTAMRMRP
jgi:hypothetical protein